MNTTSPVRPELVEGEELDSIFDFESQRNNLWKLTNTKSFEVKNNVHELMLIYALQINDLCIGLHAIEKLITNTQNKLQQSQWVLLRAIFEATIKLSYLCCDTKMTKIRSEELNHAGVIDQLKSMKALFSAFPSDEKGVLAIAHLEEKISLYLLASKSIFQNSFEAPLNSAYNVIIKNPLLRHKLEQDLDIQLPINAELDDKPYLNEEIFRYDNN